MAENSYLSSFRDAHLCADQDAQLRIWESTLTIVVMDSGLDAARRPGMTDDGMYAGDDVYSAACRCARASLTSASSSTVWIGVKSRWAMYSGRVGVRM
jgi:hypothetical protein